MEETRRRRGLWERMSLALGLPVDAVAGLPLVELVGDSRVRVENHRGILAYSSTEIHIGGGKLAVRVRGEGLVLKAMDRQELLIAGRVLSVELE